MEEYPYIYKTKDEKAFCRPVGIMPILPGFKASGVVYGKTCIMRSSFQKATAQMRH